MSRKRTRVEKPFSQMHDRRHQPSITRPDTIILILTLLIQLFLFIPVTHAQVEAFGCDDYNKSCGLCAAAPPELMCGWCADSGTCHFGSIQGPAQGECKGVSWSFGVSSCQSPQALCDKHTSCDQCVRNTTTCNWCDTLSRCVYTDTSGTSTTSGGVSCSQWDWSCPSNTTQSVTCSAQSDCGTCTSVSGCSWCGYALTGSCIDHNGACASTLPLSATPAACPIPSSDTQGSSPCNGFDGAGCSKCSQYSKCGWCFSSSTCDSGSELGADYGHCGNSPTNFASSTNQCTTKNGAVTSDASFTTASFILAFDNSSDSSTIELVGILLLSLCGLFSVIFIVTLACVRYIAPTQGAISRGTTSTGLQPNASDKVLRVVPMSLTSLSIAIKICSFGVDEWNVSQANGVHTSYGLFAARTTYQGSIHMTSYGSICSGTTRTDLCGLLQTGGALTLVWYAFALFNGSTLAFYLIQALRDFTQLKRTALTIWRLAAIQFSCTSTGLLCWLAGGLIVLNHIDSNSTIGISFILGLIGMVTDLALIFATRYTLRRTPRLHRSHSSRSPATIARPAWLKPIGATKPFGGDLSGGVGGGGNSSLALSGSNGNVSTLESVPEEDGGGLMTNPSIISRGGSQFLAQSGTGPGDGRSLRGTRTRPSLLHRAMSQMNSNLQPQSSVDPDIDPDGGVDAWKKYILDDGLTALPGVVTDDELGLPIPSPLSNNTLIPPTSSTTSPTTSSGDGNSVGDTGHARSPSHAIEIKGDTPDDDRAGDRRQSESSSHKEVTTSDCVRCGADVIIGPHSICAHCGVAQPYTPNMVEHSVAKRTPTR